MHAVLAVHMSPKAATMSPPVSVVTAADEARAAALHLVKAPATKMLEAAVYAAAAVGEKRTSGGVGGDDGGYAHALQAALTHAMR
jgi:hypothetical protein